MELSRQQSSGKLYIRAVGADGISIGDTSYAESLIVSPERVEPNWPVTSVSEISEQNLQAVLAFEPELVLIGTGRTQRFLDPAIAMVFHSRGVGIEVMTTAAACRTFNVLVMEERRVVAALLPPDTP